MSTEVTMFDAVARVRALLVLYFDAQAGIGMGDIKMSPFEKCLLVQFDEPVHQQSCDDRGKWKVKKPDGTITLPISVSLVSDTHVLLSLPTIVVGAQYELAYTIMDLTGVEVKGSIPFVGI